MKKFILSLFVGLIGLVNFSSAVNVTYNGTVNGKTAYEIPVPAVFDGCNFSVECVYENSTYIDQVPVFRYFLKSSPYYSPNNSMAGSQNLTPTIHSWTFDFSSFSCTVPKEIAFNVTYNPNVVNFSCVFSGESNFVLGGSSSCPECPTCQSCSPFSGRLDLNYYEDGEYINATIFGGKYSVNLPTGLNWVGFEDGDSYGINVSSNVPVCTGDSGNGLSGVFSNLYINNILHPGKENIFVTIPDYIYWDYVSYDTGFDLYVGSGYDQDYIDGVLSVQSYRPTSEDFTQTFVGGLILFTPYVVILVFVIFVWKLFKKIFKTK